MPYVERELLLKDGPPWGFRLQDTSAQGLVISRVRRRSPAANGGAHEGDVVLAINKNPTNGMSHHRAVQLLEGTFFILTIKVGRQEIKVERAPDPPKPPPRAIPIPVSTSINVSVSRPPPKPVPVPVPEPVVEPEPEPPEVHSIPIEKLIKEYDVPAIVEKSKKHFADSAFYEDPDKYYPSVEEQKQMAKKVADQLTAILNKGSRGAKMYERRRNKWCAGDTQAEVEEETMISPQTNGAGLMFAAPPAPLLSNLPPSASPAPPAPPAPMLFNLPPAPPPPNLALLAGIKKKRTTQEVFEEAKQLPKTKHDAVAPQKCFEIAAALKDSNSRGSQLFAKRRAKSKKWELEGPEPPKPQLDVQQASPPWAAELKRKPPAKPFVSEFNGNNNAYATLPRSTPVPIQVFPTSRASTTSSTSSHSLVNTTETDVGPTPPWRSPAPSWRPPSTSQDSLRGSVDSETGFYSSLPRPGSSTTTTTTTKQEWRSVQFKLPQKSPLST